MLTVCTSIDDLHVIQRSSDTEIADFHVVLIAGDSNEARIYREGLRVKSSWRFDGHLDRGLAARRYFDGRSTEREGCGGFVKRNR